MLTILAPEHHLYTLVASYLQANPTTKDMPLRLQIQGMPPPDGPIPPPAVPKGYKINEILPLHSPALSGGGVSENILRDMMQGAYAPTLKLHPLNLLPTLPSRPSILGSD